MSKPIPAIHGRFQPFHNGHLDCLRWASSYSNRVIVGITNPDPRDHLPVDLAPHRHLEAANPFTYFERAQMVRGAAVEAGLDPDRLIVVPFFLQSPETWSHYLPPGVIHFVTILGKWEQQKAERLEALGYTVERRIVERYVSGTEVREALQAGRSIEHMVPLSTRRFLERLGGMENRTQ